VDVSSVVFPGVDVSGADVPDVVVVNTLVSNVVGGPSSGASVVFWDLFALLTSISSFSSSSTVHR